MRFLQSRFFAGVLAGVLLVFAVATFINKTSVADWIVAPLLMPDSTGPTEVIVVLGAGVIGACTPNHNALRRVMLGVRLWREHPASTLLFTGAGNGTCPVAVAMAQAALEMGVSADRVRVETASASTHENAEMSAALLRGSERNHVLLVTDRLHMRRAAGVFAHLGYAVQRASVPIYEGHEDNVSMLYAGLREYVALGYYRLRGWIDAAPAS